MNIKELKTISYKFSEVGEQKGIHIFFENESSGVKELIGKCEWRREHKLPNIIWLKSIYVQHDPIDYQRKHLGTYMLTLLKAYEHFDITEDKILCHPTPTPPTTMEGLRRFYAYNEIYVGDQSGVSTQKDIAKFTIPNDTFGDD